jgi:hypothetical protein
VTVYIPFFLAAFCFHDWKPKSQVPIIGTLAAMDALMMFVFAGLVKWI